MPVIMAPIAFLPGRFLLDPVDLGSLLRTHQSGVTATQGHIM